MAGLESQSHDLNDEGESSQNVISGIFSNLKDTNITIDDIKYAIEHQKSHIKIEVLTKGLAIGLMKAVDAGGKAFGVVPNKADALRHLIIAFVDDCSDKNVLQRDLLWKKVDYARKKVQKLGLQKRKMYLMEEFECRVRMINEDPPPVLREETAAAGPGMPLTPRALMRELDAIRREVAAAESKADAAESKADAAESKADAARSGVAAAESKADAAIRALRRRDHRINALQDNLQKLSNELSSLRTTTDRRNQQQREYRLGARIAVLQEQLETALKSSTDAEKRADNLQDTLEKQKQYNERARSKTYRAKGRVKSLEIEATRIQKKIEANLESFMGSTIPISTRTTTAGRPFTASMRKCIMDLLSLGVAHKKIGKVLEACGVVFERKLGELPSTETVRHIAAEAGVVAEMAAIHRYASAVDANGGVALYTDTTGHKNLDVMPLIAGDKDEDGRPQTFMLGLKRLASHTSDDQFQAILGILSHLAQLAESTGFDEDAIEKLSIRYLMMMMADHAADQSRLHELLEEEKDTLWQEINGYTFFSEEQKRVCRTIVKVGCGMHKLNIMSRVAKETMKQFWATQPSKPIALPNAGVFRVLLQHDTEDDIIERSKQEMEWVDCGGYKTMILLSLLFSNTDAKMGYGDVWKGYKERRGLDIKLQPTSEVRFASAEANAGIVLKHVDYFIEFMNSMKNGKDNQRFNNLERNVVNALKDEDTLDELAIMALLFTLVHMPFLIIVRAKRGIGAVHTDLLKMEDRMTTWVDMDDEVLYDRLQLVGTESKNSLPDVVGNTVKRKRTYTGFHVAVERMKERPHCFQMFRCVVTEMKKKLANSLKDFAPGGQYHDLDEMLANSLDYVLATNDISESVLGQFRVLFRKVPNARSDSVAGSIMYRMNIGLSGEIPDDWMAKAILIARERLGVTKMEQIRPIIEVKEKRIKETIEHAAAVVENREKREREIRSVLPIVDMDEILKLKAPELLEQLRRWQIEIPKEVILSRYKNMKDKQEKLKDLFQSQSDVFNKLKNEREQRLEEQKAEEERAKKRKFDEENPFGHDWTEGMYQV